MSLPAPPPIPGRDRSGRRQSAQDVHSHGWSAPHLVGVGVDGKSSGRDAAVLGALLVRATGAEVMLIAIHEEPLLPASLPGGMSWTAIEQAARTMLAETRDALAPAARMAVRADVLVWRGLRQVARHEQRDLLVVGSGQAADAGRVGIGRSAGELMGHLECPLAIAPSGFQQHTARRLERIGVGFDGTPEAQAALDLAGSIASTAGATLEVRVAIDDGVAGGFATEHIVLREDALSERQLVSTFARDRAATSATGVPANLKVEVGMPTDVLAELCDSVDLLVIGSDHSGPPGRVQSGRTGRAILELATCPVITVPRPAASHRSPHGGRGRSGPA